MSTSQHQVATGQASRPESQDGAPRNFQEPRTSEKKSEAQIDAYLAGPDSRATDTAAIQRRTLQCQALFESCQKNPYVSGDDWIDKMAAEFNWWSLGIGAAKGGRSSLDYRVQTRDDVRNTLINLLESLATSLNNYIDAASQHHNPSQFTTSPAQEDELEESAAHGSDLQPSDDDSIIGEQRYYIKTTIRYLSQISIAIRKSGTKFRHERADKLLAAREPELQEFRDYMRHLLLMSPTTVHILHGVSYQHSLTGDPLCLSLWITLKAYFTDVQRLTQVQNRLIRANLVRRNRFDLYLARYNQRVQDPRGSQSLSTQVETMTISPAQEPPIPAAGQSHHSQVPSKRGEGAPIQQVFVKGSQRSSQSATNIGSFVMPERPQEQKPRSVSTKLSQGVLKQDYPKCPGAEGESFWCPYCAQLLDSSYSDPRKNRRWRGHVVEDLSPYVCVYEDCDSPDAMYVTTAEWKKHIRDRHSAARWICDPCWLNSDSPEEFEFDTQEEWHKHTLTEHEDEVDECDLLDLAELSQRTGVTPIACPLCYEDVSLRNPETDKHLAEHLHSFALQALPWELTGCDDETKVSLGSDTRKPHDSSESEQSATEEPQDENDDDEFAAFANLVNSIMYRSDSLPRPFIPGSALSSRIGPLLNSIESCLSRSSERFHHYPPSFRPEILASLARLDSLMQGFEDIPDYQREQQPFNMWKEDLAQAFKSFQQLESLSGFERASPSDHPAGMHTGVSEASARTVQYTVGWICATKTELVAARAFFDEEHGETSHNDDNIYALGRVGEHNVVIVSLPRGEYGLGSVATVARDLLRSFPDVRFVFLVGIAGGVPSERSDIRLGDVVVGIPWIGVVQYDYGKTIQSQALVRTGLLNQPSQLVITAMTILMADCRVEVQRLNKAVEDALKRFPEMRRKYSRPPVESDRLYQPDFIHPTTSGECSEVCGNGPDRLVQRSERKEDEGNPDIHYGTIASSYRLMKDAKLRDKLAAENGILCFENEAAGLTNDYPCLTIRGICDYCDTHNNKEWQGFAAMTAAAYAREVLCRIPSTRVMDERPIQELLSSSSYR